MKKLLKYTITGFWVSCFVIGCVSTNTKSPSQPTVTAETLLTPVPSLRPNTINNCITEYPEKPKEYPLSGVVAIRSLSAKTIGLGLSLLNLRDNTFIKIDTENQSVWDAKVSPDNSTLTYTWFNYETSQWELVLTNAIDSNRKVIRTSKDAFGIYSWVNNNQIFLDAPQYTIVGINRDTEDKIIPYDFPEFDAFDNIHHFFVIFDPTVSRVIYRANTRIHIFDLRTRTTVGRIPDSYDRGIIAAWSPSGTRAAIVSANPEDIKNIASDEIFIVEQNGQIKQLTHLLESYDTGRTIDSLSWSPDEKKIAFWRHDGNGYLTLMTVDTNSGEVLNRCVTNVTQHSFPIYLPAPIWLSDSNHMIVESRYENDKSKLLIVNISENIAFPIAENSNPVGWLKDN